LLELLPPDRCELPPPEDRCELLPPDEREPLDDREEELRPREDAAEDRRLDALPLFELLPLFALALFGLLRELEPDALLPLVLPLLLRDELLLFGLEPLELRDVVFLLLWDRELAWAIFPSLSRCPAFSHRSTPCA
jgi:hypothetical protein